MHPIVRRFVYWFLAVWLALNALSVVLRYCDGKDEAVILEVVEQ